MRWLCSIVGLIIQVIVLGLGGNCDPTQGFESLPIHKSIYRIQKPYNLAVSKRYRYSDGIHKCWVLSTDKPHTLTSHTNPRTEISFEGYKYREGVWQFEAKGYVPDGTSGVTIMQVFGGSNHATSLMLTVHKGSLFYYNARLLVENIYDQWFRLNVIHDVNASKLKVYINGSLKLQTSDRGGRFHFFKCGVYAALSPSSHYMESRWKDIKIFKKL